MASEWLHVLLPSSDGLSDSHVGLTLEVRLYSGLESISVSVASLSPAACLLTIEAADRRKAKGRRQSLGASSNPDHRYMQCLMNRCSQKMSRPVGDRLLCVRTPDLREPGIASAPKHGEEHNARRSSDAFWLAEPIVGPPDAVTKGQRVVGVVIVVRESLLEQADGRGRSGGLGGACDAGRLCGR